MASRADRDGHLDADAGREVVFCHACSNEWYRDDHGLMCPNCESEVTEIVNSDNDPRQMDNSSASSSPGLPPLRHADDSDPDEADIEEHMGPQGFHFRRSTRTDPDDRHHDPSVDPVLQRFQDMIQSFSQPRRSEGTSLFGRPDNDSYSPPRFRRTTITSGTFGGGTASVTIFSGPVFGSRGAGGVGDDGDESTNPNNLDPFQTLFSNVIRDLGPPDGAGEGGPQFGLARSLQEILNHFSPANAMMGDAVYSQEALDRIVTQLMETTSQSNAAPRASNEAIANLDRKTVDKGFLGPEGKAECSICIDAMKEGEVATYLPCKHWFHDECIVPWLKQHNTCPVCRTPIEKGQQRQENNRGESGTGAAGAPGPSNIRFHVQSPTPPANFSRNNSDQSRDIGNRSENGYDTPTGRAAADLVSSVNLDPQSRPSNPSQSRLNEALRSVANTQRERENDRRNRANMSEMSYDTSRMQRRTSHSPPSPRAFNLAEQGARMRQRSPSENDRRGNGDRETRRQSGALSWLRERFAGGNGSGGSQGSSRDEQQP
ncbi:Zinc finger, RING/FYVE/PHD-type, partial [Metarhizium majus ARSEF 297]